jgi:cellulase
MFQDSLNANCGKKEFTIPSDLATGDYLLRAEEIALHAAQSAGGAQLYMTCYQIHIEGTGSATPQGVKFPGAYSATDPGILVNIYQQIDDYIIPGPELYKVGGSGGSSPAQPPVAQPTTTQPPPAASTTAAPVVTVAPSSSAAPEPAPTQAPEPEQPAPQPETPAPEEDDCEDY